MRFVDLLNNAAWTATYRDATLTPHSARRLVERAASRLHHAELAAQQALRAATGAAVPAPAHAPAAAPAPADSRQLTVFCAFTPLETLLCYCVASRLGLLAAVLSPRTLPRFLDDVGPGLAVRLVAPSGHKLPDAAASYGALLLDLAPAIADADADADDAPSDASSGPAPAPAQECRLVFSTSGTTGKPKRVLCAESRLIGNAAMVAGYLGLRASDRTLCTFPAHFMYGLSTSLCTLLTGGHIEYCDFLHSGLLASKVVERGITVLPVIGDWADGLSERWRQLGHVPQRLLLLNASDRLTRRQAETLLPHASALWNNFGQTESGPRMFAVNLSQIDDLGSVTYFGTIAPGFPAFDALQLRIAGDDADGCGELSYRTPYAMLGYLNDDGSIAPAPEWIASGDLFRRAANGAYLWAGRAAHTIKVNGQFVSLRALADDLLTYQTVTGVGYARGHVDELYLFVEAEQPASDLGAQLRRVVARTLRGKYSDIRIVPALPRTESGKIDFKQLTLTLAKELA
jgi:acyl-coenzyme A synthetase/AMP-(fatty) acid ligase